MADANDTAGVPLPPPLLFLVPWLAGWALDGVRHQHVAHGGTAMTVHVGGVMLIAIAVALFVAAERAMRRKKTPVIPFKPTTAIATDGPFARTRNPLYLAMALLHAGLALATNMLWPLLMLPLSVALVQTLVIRREEAYLSRKFGAEYDSYRERVRRWL